MKTAVVLFNLGGPDGPDAVEPFLFNLFSAPKRMTFGIHVPAYESLHEGWTRLFMLLSQNKLCVRISYPPCSFSVRISHS